MRIPLIACAIIASATLLGACSPYSRTDRTLGGAAIGAVTGGVIGGAAGRGGGAVAGAVIGGVTGGVIGAATTPRACRARDRYGRRIRVQCP